MSNKPFIVTAVLPLLAGIAVPTSLSAQEQAYPQLLKYRICGVRAVAAMEARDQASSKPRLASIVATEATKQCESLLPPAVEETLAQMKDKSHRAELTADFRQRSIADLEEKIEARRKEGGK